MFGKSKLLQQRDTLTQQVNSLERYIAILEKENTQAKAVNIKFTAENDDLKKQLIQYQAISSKVTPEVNGVFKPATSAQGAIKQFKANFTGDFYCFDEIDLDILNVFLHKIALLKSGQYKPNVEAEAACDDFFDFKKRLVKREYLAMLYALLDIKVTSRRFESFDMEIDTDELISMIETLFRYFK